MLQLVDEILEYLVEMGFVPDFRLFGVSFSTGRPSPVLRLWNSLLCFPCAILSHAQAGLALPEVLPREGNI